MKLYQFPGSPNCLKVHAVAHELGVPLELVTVNIFRCETRAPSFRALNPNGLVPVLVDGDFGLWESNAILTYLATTHRLPDLLPMEARERASVDRWLHWESARLGPAVTKVAFERFVRPMVGGAPPDAAATTAARREFAQCCCVLEGTLARAEYATGRLTVADFALASVLGAAATAQLDLSAFRRTTAWLQRMLARESFQRGLADARASMSQMYPSGGTDGGLS
jgi:glutathione S-transferase